MRGLTFSYDYQEKRKIPNKVNPYTLNVRLVYGTRRNHNHRHRAVPGGSAKDANRQPFHQEGVAGHHTPCIAEARKNVVTDAQDVLENDPTAQSCSIGLQTGRYWAVRSNILQVGSVEHPPNINVQRAGPEPHTARWQAAVSISAPCKWSYEGVDRGFILRFQNAGTAERRQRFGGRGALRARHWFGRSSAFQLDAAATSSRRDEALLATRFQRCNILAKM